MRGALAAVVAAFVAVSPAAAAPPEVTAKAYVVENGATGEVLAQRSPNLRVPIASITKLMTVLVALEHSKLDDARSWLPAPRRRSARRPSTSARASVILCSRPSSKPRS